MDPPVSPGKLKDTPAEAFWRILAAPLFDRIGVSRRGLTSTQAAGALFRFVAVPAEILATVAGVVAVYLLAAEFVKRVILPPKRP